MKCGTGSAGLFGFYRLGNLFGITHLGKGWNGNSVRFASCGSFLNNSVIDFPNYSGHSRSFENEYLSAHAKEG
jgi:hypothetical protein